MMRDLALACALLLAVGGAHATAEIPPPDEVVKTTADKVLARVSAEREALRADPQRLHALVDEMIVPHFDFSRMARWVLGKYWREANDEERARFVEEFKNLLVRTYATALLEYANQSIKYYPPQQSEGSNLVTVRTELEQPGSVPVPIVYRMHVRDGEWKVFDLAVDGVSLITTYRASFASEIRDRGLAGLIEDLAARNSATLSR